MSKRYGVNRVRVKSPPTTTIPHMVSYQKGLRTSVEQSPRFGDDPAIKTNFDKWSQSTDDLEAAYGLVASLRAQLVSALGAVGSLRARYLLDGAMFTTTIRSVFVNDAAAVLSMGLAIGGETVPVTLTWPADLRVVPIKGQPGKYTVRWHGVHGAGVYELQRGPSPTDEASFTGVYADKFVKFADEGPLGQIVWYRVRARGNGVSAWSPACAYLIR